VIVGEIGVDDPYDVYLQGADFQEANLEGTVWEDAMLVGARFGGANLSRATLKGCNLSEAEFTHCEMLGTQIIGCDLAKADFAHAVLGDTVIASSDLSDMRGLKSVVHRFASSVSVDSMEKSRTGLDRNGKNLESLTAFLLGAGVPQRYLEAFDAART
jgi:uncharacterized protein YjbI with pentapeptide repeats